uniref:PDZ domain-containing protein n=1 Tax=Rhabditophanes sp. KR3021 TaxID=114890 RepID=A0AC35U054_9BILA
MRYSRSESRNQKFKKEDINALLSAQATQMFGDNSVVVNATAVPHQPRFECALAHGSPVSFIAGFKNLGELYKSIGEAFNVDSGEIMYCTLNTQKVEPNTFITNNINVGDIIYAHVKGQKKEVELTKTGDALGITITDNGNDMANPAIAVGDHIEKLNGISMVGMKHCDVARSLRSLKVGETFILRLLEPTRTGFTYIAARTNKGAPKSLDSVGTGTLRFKSNGEAVMQEAPNQFIVNKMNDIFDSYLGLHDDELALTVWELGKTATSAIALTTIIADSHLGAFDFPAELIFDMWGVVDDFKNQRLQETSKQ